MEKIKTLFCVVLLIFVIPKPGQTSNCPECSRKWTPVFDDEGSVAFMDCSKRGKDCEIPGDTKAKE